MHVVKGVMLNPIKEEFIPAIGTLLTLRGL